MTQTEHDDIITVGFYFGVRLMEALHGIKQSPEGHQKIQDCLRDVADGNLSLGRTPAELRLHYSQLDAQKLEDFHRKTISRNREQAQAVLRCQTLRDPGLDSLK